jgi:manganese/iron transport system permease protein
MEIFNYNFIQNAIIAAVIGGVSCSLVGVFVVLCGISFLGVTLAHAAFAGAIVGMFFGINPLGSAFLFCLLVSAFIGPLADKAHFNAHTASAILFSLTLGIAFLFLFLVPGSKINALSFIWGNILTVSSSQLIAMSVILLLLLIFLSIFFEKIKVVLFDREIAAAVGIPQKFIFYILLFFTGSVISFNLQTIGGLLIFSLIINPAASAYQLTYSLNKMFLLSTVFAVLASLAGIFVSYFLNLPTGAVIIIVSSFIFLLAVLASPKKGFSRLYK